MTLRAYIEKLIRPVPPSRRRDRSRHHEQHPKPWAKPWLERLEDRLAPANLVVLNSNDSGAASLRQAILSSGPGDSISFSPDLAGQTITLTSGVLTITHSLSINGLGADQLTVSGNNASSVFSITSGNVTLSGLMITGGKTAFSGGGVQISTTGITTLVGDDIEFNTAGSYGGGVLLKSPLNSQATLTITNSTIANNSAARSGAGIEVLDTSATITNSTIANNQLTASAPVGGAGVDVLAFGAGASILLESDTLSGNLVATKSESADLAVDAAIGNGNFTATAILHNTILNGTATNPMGTPNAEIGSSSSTITSSGHNISSDGTGNLTGPGDLPNTNPLLDGFGFHGGATPTLATLFNSPAINNGDPGAGAPTTDQRGAIRGASSGPGAMANAGITPDIGAYEQSSLYVVTSSDATTTPLAYDTSVVGTVRGGVEWANSSINLLVPNSTPNVVLFDTAGTFATPQTITLGIGTLRLTNTTVPESIWGPGVSGASALTISGNNAKQVFRVAPNVSATISGMIITQGESIGLNGGGVYNLGTLALSNVVVSNSYSILGGGVANSQSANLTITNSTISKNSARFSGGLANTGGIVLIAGSTISGNTAALFAAGITNFSGTLTINDSTISGNSGGGSAVGVYGGMMTLNSTTIAANPAGGLMNSGGTLSTRNTILAGNTGFDISGNLGSQGHNLIQNPAGGSGFASSDILNMNPRLLALANNGGPTQTMGLGFSVPGDPSFPANPAVDTGDNNGAPATDQRGPGFARIINGIIDVGSFEDQLVLTAPTSPQPIAEASSQVFNLGSFTDAAPGVSSWSVTIIWGDGSSNTPLTLISQGAIPNQMHIFADEGTYTVTVQVADTKGDTGQKTFTVSVTDSNVVAAGGFSLTAVEGNLSATQTVATFTDPAGAEPNDGTHYSASINWGDGGPASTGTISFAGGTFSVSGNHTYADEGTYTLTVTVNHELTMPQTVNDTATVSNPNVVATGGFAFTLAGGAASGTKTVATFTDPGGPEAISDYSASITWGDGSAATAGSISLTGSTFSVSGNHTYADEGAFTITVTINHENTTPQTVTDTTTVSNPNVLATGGFSFTAAEGSASASQIVATFTDPGGPEAISDYSASITWGDGSTATVGSITFSGTTFTVSGSHTYGEEGSYAITVTINHETTTPQTVTSTATVADPAVVGGSMTLSATAGSAFFSQAVASFTDPGGAEPNPSDPSGTIANHYKVVSISWGDGTPLDTSSGSISYTGSPGSKSAPFTVSGSHTYAAAGSYTITAIVNHEGVMSTVTGTGTVASLGQFITSGNSQTKTSSFWASIVGQELLRRFGLTAGNQTLGQWLASTFPKLYGGVGGATNLSSFTDSQISIYYLGLFHQFNTNMLDAEVLSAALYVFATTSGLGGSVAAGAPYGLPVSTAGLGAFSVNIGFNGAAFGVPNFTVLNVFQILQVANNATVAGEPWGTNIMLRNEGLSVFQPINGDGH